MALRDRSTFAATRIDSWFEKQSAARLPDIRSVAALAKVSIATVSRTINGSPAVSERLSKRVWQAIDQLKYFPNTHARSLVSGRSRIFGIIVENITNQSAIVRDLAMIRVAAKHEARSHVFELANVFRARVVDVAPESLTLEITGGEEKIDGLLELLRPYGVLEMVRTGIVAMRRGSKTASVESPAEIRPIGASNDDVSYSV